MLVRDVMTTRAESIGPEEKVHVAARRMRELGVGALVVCDARGAPVGILTDRDIVVRSTAEASDPREAAVRSAMTPQVVSCLDGDELSDAAARMSDRAVRRVVVVDAADRVVGLLSVDDIAFHSTTLAAGILASCRSPDRPPQPKAWKWWD